MTIYSSSNGDYYSDIYQMEGRATDSVERGRLDTPMYTYCPLQAPTSTSHTLQRYRRPTHHLAFCVCLGGAHSLFKTKL
jgi:hypothetical protein